MQDALVFVVLLALCLAGRLMEHMPNFTPVAAVALFGGFYFRRRWMALTLPLLAMLISDCSLGFAHWGVMASVYVAMAAPVAARRWLKQKLSVWRVGAAAVGSAFFFFIMTNFAVWLFGGAYSHDLAGLFMCYAAGLIFFKFTLGGNLVWSGALFGAYLLCDQRMAVGPMQTVPNDQAQATGQPLITKGSEVAVV